MLSRTWFDLVKSRFLNTHNRRRRRTTGRRARVGAQYRPEALESRNLMAFNVLAEYATGLNPNDVALTPVNPGGQFDLVIAHTGGGTVGARLGNPDGSFGGSLSSAAGTYTRSVVAGDFTGDGKADLVVLDSAGAQLLPGNGDGTFLPPQAIPLPGQFPPGYADATSISQSVHSVAVGDLNGDGKLDLAVGGSTVFSVIGSGYYGYYYSYNYDGYVNVLLGNGDGSFAYADADPSDADLDANHLGDYRFPSAITIGDLNNDGQADVLTADGSDLSTLLGNGTGALGAAIHSGVGNPLRSISLGDVDSDGILDTVLGNGYQLIIQKGQGDGSFLSGATVNAGLYNSAVMGDVNADGKLDLVAVGANNVFTCTSHGYYGCYDGYNTTYRQASVLLGNGIGDFALPLTSSLGSELGYGWLADLALADLTGDGLPELATVDYHLNKAIIALNDGDWTAPTAAAISDATVVEGNTGSLDAVFTVTLTGDHAGVVTIDYATSDYTGVAGADYVAKSGTLSFAPGEYSKTISVPVIGDREGEWDELFFVSLSNPTGAILVDSQAIGTIVDNEPRLTIEGGSVVEGNTGTKPLAFTLTLSAAYDAPVTVNFTTSDGDATVAGGDYVALAGQATIAAGQTTATINVQVKGDRRGEYDEVFYISLTGASGALLANDLGYGVIVDNEPRLNIDSVSVVEGNSGSKVMTFTVSLAVPYDQNVTVKFATRNDTAKSSDGDYVAKSGTLTFLPGETVKTIAVTIKGDKKYENDESFYVLLSGASSNAMIENAYGWGTIVNDDARPRKSKRRD